MPETDVLDPALLDHPLADARVAALRDAVRELLDGYGEMARRLPSFGPPPEVERALLEPLQRAAESAAALLYDAVA